MERQASLDELPTESIYLLREVLLRGEILRGETARITGRPERTARLILRDPLGQHLLTVDAEKGPVRLAFPANVVGYTSRVFIPRG